MPQITLSIVDLPAPFLPVKPILSLSPMLNVIPSKSLKPPNVTERLFNAINFNYIESPLAAIIHGRIFACERPRVNLLID